MVSTNITIINCPYQVKMSNKIFVIIVQRWTDGQFRVQTLQMSTEDKTAMTMTKYSKELS